MGVKGLTKYINNHAEIYFQSFQLHDSYLAIDGNSTVYCLYTTYARCNCAFGGDYYQFSACVSNFFDELSTCNIKPLVIFDGGTERKKIKTVISRAREKIHSAAIYTPQSQSEKKFFPLLLFSVFIDVMNEKGIKYVTTMYEADSAVAAVAKALNCPVLSSDSDFYIFGSSYIPFFTLELGVVKLENGTGYAKCCKIYKVESLLCNFEVEDPLLLPLFAMLMGNDYVQRSTFNNFFAHLKLRKSKTQNKEQLLLEAVLNWMKHCTFDYALSSILRRIPKHDRRKIVAIVEMIINGYAESPTHLLEPLNVPKEDYHKNITCPSNDFKYTGDINNLEYIEATLDTNMFDTHNEDDNDDDNHLHNYNDANDNKESALSFLPDWFLQEYSCGIIPTYLMNIVTHRLYIPYTQIENFSHPPSILVCKKILRVLFALMIPRRQRQRCCINCIIRGNNAKLIQHKLTFQNDDFVYRLPSLQNLRTIHVFGRKQILHNTLNLCGNVMNGIPPNWQLYIGVLIFWIEQQENLSIIKCHVYSLLFCMLLHIVDMKIGYYRTMKHFNQKYEKVIANLTKETVCQAENSENITIANACKGVKEYDCLLAAPFFIENSTASRKIFTMQEKFSVTIVHFFAQFQYCLKHIMDLNTLLGCPYKPPIIANMYNGTVLYRLVANFKQRKNIDAYIATILQQSPGLLNLFKTLLCKVNSVILSSDSRRSQWTVLHSKKEKRQKLIFQYST